MRRFIIKRPRRRGIALLSALLSALVWVWSSYAVPKDSALFMRAVDGDTLEVMYQGQKERVRLIGVDTPESAPNDKARRDAERSHEDMKTIIAMGKEAKNFLKSILAPHTALGLEFDVDKRDKYGRLLAYVYLPDGRMLNEVLAAEGYAQAATYPPNVKYAALFREKVSEARANRRGLWGSKK